MKSVRAPPPPLFRESNIAACVSFFFFHSARPLTPLSCSPTYSKDVGSPPATVRGPLSCKCTSLLASATSQSPRPHGEPTVPPPCSACFPYSHRAHIGHRPPLQQLATSRLACHHSVWERGECTTPRRPVWAIYAAFGHGLG
jgi:hypothetical protein